MLLLLLLLSLILISSRRPPARPFVCQQGVHCQAGLNRALAFSVARSRAMKPAGRKSFDAVPGIAASRS